MNSNLLVGKYYDMDPQVEDLIYGTDLKEGMVVLIEDSHLRGDPSITNSPSQAALVLHANRWCEVTELRMPTIGDEHQVLFIGLYSDGTKRSRQYLSRKGWYVKLDSLPTPSENTEDPDSDEEPDTVPYDSQGWGQGELLHEDHVKYVKEDAAATMSMWGGGHTPIEGDAPETKSLDVVQQELTAELQFHVKSPVDWDQVMGIIQRVAPPITRGKHFETITTEDRHSFEIQG